MGPNGTIEIFITKLAQEFHAIATPANKVGAVATPMKLRFIERESSIPSQDDFCAGRDFVNELDHFFDDMEIDDLKSDSDIVVILGLEFLAQLFIRGPLHNNRRHFQILGEKMQ